MPWANASTRASSLSILLLCTSCLVAACSTPRSSAPRDAAAGDGGPLASEIGDGLCGNGLDDDADGAADCADSDCAMTTLCAPPPVERGDALCTNGSDDDNDGSSDCADPDCTSAMACMPPTTPETSDSACSNGIDDDRDGTIDCDDFTCLSSSVCAPTNPRPAEAPAVLFVGVSGHELSTGPYNREYLESEGTLDALAVPIVAHGFTVQGIPATDNLYDAPAGADPPAALGFLTLLRQLIYVRDNWIADFDNPTHVIVVAHSHGDVWAHLALLVLEEAGAPIPVDILIDLDGVSIGWEGMPIPGLGFGDGWSAIIDDYDAMTGMTWPFDVANAADSWSIPGRSELQDSEDVVPNCVALDLEVQSADLTPIRDTEDNYRLDGSRRGIYYYGSPTNHEGTHGPSAPAVSYAVSFIEAAYGW